MEIKCPKCNTAYPMYSKKREVYVCEECGHEWTEEKKTVLLPLPATPLRIFLSYGHDRNEELVLRIKSDLEKRGHDVWLDRSEIKFTDDWRRAITEGIVESQRFLSFLSKHSTRDPGVCLDEIGIAIGVKGGDIQTILVESEKEVSPPATVSHVQWLDMHDWKEKREADATAWEEWYQEKFSEIVRVVESEQGRCFAGEIEDLKNYLKPVLSDSRILELIGKGFVGREWMEDDLKKWRVTENRTSRIYWITGDPGTGKSAFAAHLSHYGRDRVVASQFIQWDKPDHRTPERVVRSIAFQLAARLPDYRKLLLTLPEIDKLDGKNASELFDYLLATPLSQTIGGGREKYLVVLDALDEAGEGGENKLADILAGNVDRLPVCISFVVTSRPESSVLGPLQRYDPYEIKVRKEENLKDMEEYLKRVFSAELEKRGEDERERILGEILRRSEDVFLYVACVCEEVKEGRLSLDRLDEFPQGLGGVYSQYFKRQFPDKEKYKEKIRPMLQIVLAARDSFPLELLRKRYGMTRSALNDLLLELSNLFPVKERAGEKCLSVYHKTLADWLTNDERALAYWISLEDGNEELAEWGMELYREAGANDLPEYFLRHLPAHLIATERWNDLIGDDAAPGVLTDLRYIQKKCEVGQKYNLMKDYNIVLDALPEFREEKEYLARRDEAVKHYNAAVKKYARERRDRLKSGEAGSPLEEPLYPKLPDILKDENPPPPIPEENSPRAARLRHFSNFFRMHIHFYVLSEQPSELLGLALNYAADGPVVYQAERFLGDSKTPFLKRSLRPPLPPFRMLFQFKFKDNIKSIPVLSVSSDGRRAFYSDWDGFELWDLESGEPGFSCEGKEIYESVQRAMSGNGLAAISASVSPFSEEPKILLWDLNSNIFKSPQPNNLLDELLRSWEETTVSVSMNEDGSRALLASRGVFASLKNGECEAIFNICNVSVSLRSDKPIWNFCKDEEAPVREVKEVKLSEFLNKNAMPIERNKESRLLFVCDDPYYPPVS